MRNLSRNNFKVAGIYLIENIKNNKIYIGGTKNMYSRVVSHNSSLRRNRHGNYRLQKFLVRKG